MKVNSPVNYLSGNFKVKSINENGSVTLNPMAKNLDDITVEPKYIKHIVSGFKKEKRRFEPPKDYLYVD